MNDEQEFRSESDKWTPKQEPKKSPINELLDECAPPTENKTHENPGAFTQYAYNGEGFTPVSSTVKHLSPGVYSAEIVNNKLTFMPRKVITDKLIRLPDSKSDETIKKIQKFWTLKDEYKNGNRFIKGGYCHKKGVLLWGPAGSGKTSTVKFVMQDLIERGGIVLLADGPPEWTSDGLLALRDIEPNKPAVVVLEDFDELIARYSEARYLSMLDGEASVDQSLFIATTNYPSRFEPRIYCRPGRFADIIKIGMPSKDARQVYLENQLNDHSVISEIVKNTDGFSVDHLKALVQGVYLEGNTMEAELKRLRALFIKPKDDNGNEDSNRMGF